MTVEERVQKILSAYGICSRREAERLMTAGEVLVNGTPAALGDRADPERDRITVRGVPLRAKAPEHCYVMLHKPRGYVTTLSDEKGRANVAELVSGCGVRVYPVGRLDMYSDGLLILTDDGDLTCRLTHPSHGLKKTYIAHIAGELTELDADRLAEPFEIDGYMIRRPEVRLLGTEGGASTVEFVLAEGRNRQIRRMCERAGYKITRLTRTKIGDIAVGELPLGHWRYLSYDEVSYLRSV